MPQKNTTTRIVTTAGTSSGNSPGASFSPSAGSNLVQRGHTVTTVRETERTTVSNKRGNSVVKTKTRTVYYVDGKPVKLNWFDRIRIKFMSTYEKQAFLADKLLKQERRQYTTTTTRVKKIK